LSGTYAFYRNVLIVSMEFVHKCLFQLIIDLYFKKEPAAILFNLFHYDRLTGLLQGKNTNDFQNL
jgi:hypothetical protein